MMNGAPGTPYMNKNIASGSARKRPRDSAGGYSPYPDGPSGSASVSAADLEDALQRHSKEICNRFSFEVGQLFQNVTSQSTLVVKSTEQWEFELLQSVIEQLSDEKYQPCMKDLAQRKKIMQLFKSNKEYVKDFLLTPEKDRVLFVQELFASTK